MFDNEKKKAFYKSEDYTVRMEKIDGCERYYIKFHSQTKSPEQEISLEVFALYYGEFKNTLEKKRDERRRHIMDGDIDGFIISGKLTVRLMEQEYIEKAELETALKTCTPIQQKRFRLYHIQDYSLKQIAKMENCKLAAVSESVRAAEEKIKKYFSAAHNTD